MLGLDILKKYDQKLKSFVNSKVIPPKATESEVTNIFGSNSSGSNNQKPEDKPSLIDNTESGVSEY